MPNLKFLWLKCSKFPLTPELLPKFKNLTSLDITSQQNIHEILAPIGPKLKELSLRSSSTEQNSFSNFLKVLVVCPNLEVLYLKNFKGTVQDVKSTRPEFSEKLKLRNLVLEGVFFYAGGLLTILFFAPLLEEVILDIGMYNLGEVNLLVAFLEKGALLQNLTKFEANLQLEQYQSNRTSIVATSLMMGTEILARNMICFCPKLQTANLNFRYSDDDKDLTPYVNLVKVL